MRLFPILILALAVGCSQPAAPTPSAGTEEHEGHEHGHADGHDHEHEAPLTKADVNMPANFAELVSRVKGYRDEIKAAIESGKPEAAHRAFEELNLVLAETMTLAENAVPEDRLAAVNEARQTIRDAYLEIHQTIDAKEKLDYAAEEPAIDAAIKTLEQSANMPPG